MIIVLNREKKSNKSIERFLLHCEHRSVSFGRPGKFINNLFDLQFKLIFTVAVCFRINLCKHRSNYRTKKNRKKKIECADDMKSACKINTKCTVSAQHVYDSILSFKQNEITAWCMPWKKKQLETDEKNMRQKQKKCKKKQSTLIIINSGMGFCCSLFVEATLSKTRINLTYFACRFLVYYM